MNAKLKKPIAVAQAVKNNALVILFDDFIKKLVLSFFSFLEYSKTLRQ